MTTAPKPITATKIPGTDVPDVTSAEAGDRDRKFMSRVAVSTALMAALAAICSTYIGNHMNGAMFEQITASDQWNLYQAKGIKHALLETRILQTREAGRTVNPDDEKNLARYETEQTQIKVVAQTSEDAAKLHSRKNRVLSLAASGLQIGIALGAVAILLKRNVFWGIALLFGTAGAAALVYGLFLVV